MVDAPWLSPRENSGAFFIFGHRALGIGHWALGKGKRMGGKKNYFLRHLPIYPISPFPLGIGMTSGKGRLSK